MGRRPQTRSVPNYKTTSGHDAIQVAAHAGLVMDDWQADVLVDSLGENAAGSWSAFEVGLIVGRQNGKGSVLEARVLAGLHLFDEKLILWSAHETKTAFEAFRRVEELFSGVSDLRRRVKKVSHANGDEGIELRNGSRLRFVARTKGSGRGFSADLVILDEAYALTGDQMSALIPTLSSRPNPQIWYTSSPPLDGVTGDQLFALRKRALAGDKSLAYFDWGLPGVDLADLNELDERGRPLINLDDRPGWRRTNPAHGIRINESFIERERATMSPQDFARERLGVWPRKIESEGGVIDAGLWQSLADPGAPRCGEVAFAVDVNPARTHGVVVACGLRQDGRMHVTVVDYRPGTHWIPARVADLAGRWRPVAVALDVKGPAGSLLLDIQRLGVDVPDDADRPARGDLAVPTAGQAAQAYGQLVDAVVQRRVTHADDGPLNLAVWGAKTRPLAGGTTWDRKAGADISPLVAATLAHWAYVLRAEAVRVTYDPLMNIY